MGPDVPEIWHLRIKLAVGVATITHRHRLPSAALGVPGGGPGLFMILKNLGDGGTPAPDQARRNPISTMICRPRNTPNVHTMAAPVGKSSR